MVMEVLDLFKKGEDEEGKSFDFNELFTCCLLASLMNSEIATLHVPPLNNSLSPPPPPSSIVARVLNFFKQLFGAGQAPLGDEQKSNIQMLMEAIGAQCSGLEVLHFETVPRNRKVIPLTEGSALGGTFFAALPRLTNLRVVQINSYRCDDWALQQFGMHSPNLV